MVEEQGKKNRVWQGDAAVFSLIVGVLVTLVGSHRYTFGLGNQVETLPLILRVLEPTYLADDYYVNMASEYGPRFYYVHCVAMLARLMSVPAALLLLTCACHAAITYVTYVAALGLSGRNHLGALLACMLVMGVDSIDIGGGNSLHWNQLDAQVAATAPALLAFWFGLRNRPFLCLCISFPAVMLHPPIGLQLGGVGLAVSGASVLWPSRLAKSDIAGKMRALGTVCLCLVTLAVFVCLVWVRPTRTLASSDDFLQTVVAFRLPHHYLPSSFPAISYAMLGLFLMCFAVSWAWWHMDSGTEPNLARGVLVALVLSCLALVGGYVFVEIFPSRIWITAKVFCIALLIKWLGLMLMALTAARALSTSLARPGNPGRGSLTTGGLTTGGMLLLANGPLQPMFLFLGHSAEALRRALARRRKKAVAAASLLCVLVVYVALLAKYGFPGECQLLVVLGSLVCWFYLTPVRWLRILLPLVAAGFLVALFTIGRHHPIPLLGGLLEKRQPVVTLGDAGVPEDDPALYARDHTPPDAVFLTPPDFARFRIVADRAIVIDFRCVLLNDAAARGWLERLRDCYGPVAEKGFDALTEMDQAYHAISKERIREAGQKYGASYAVLYTETPCEFPVIHTGSRYKVVQIPSDGTAEL